MKTQPITLYGLHTSIVTTLNIDDLDSQSCRPVMLRINGRLMALTTENTIVCDDGTIELTVDNECAICPVFSRE